MDNDENLSLSVEFLEAIQNADVLSLSGSLPDDIDEDNLPLSLAFPEVIEVDGNLELTVSLPAGHNNARSSPFSVDFPDTMANSSNLSAARPSLNNTESLSLSVAIPDSTVDEDDLPLSVVFHDGLIDDDDDLAFPGDMDDADDLLSSEAIPGAIDDDSMLSSEAIPLGINNPDSFLLSEAIPQAINNTENILKNIKRCLLPKLSKNYDENEFHNEYDARNTNLKDNMRAVIRVLEEIDIKNTSDTADMTKAEKITVLSSLLNLYKELTCNDAWNSDNSKECARKLHEIFQRKCGFPMENLLKRNEICNCQELFDELLDELSKKLNSDDFKKYPSQVEVYCDIIQNIQNFHVQLNPVKVLPVALILMDDYIESNKMKGLQSCQHFLQQMTPEHFENGNYYDVIYISLKKALNHKGITITKLSQACCLELCAYFPSDVKDERLDDMYSDALDQLYLESNLYRKAELLKYTRNLLQMIQVRCIGKSLIKTVVTDCIESCLTDAVAVILLIPALECLEEWIKYSWPVWKLSVDFKVLCALLKYYSKCNTGEGGLLTQQLIATLVSLCTPEEQKVFMDKLEEKDVAENPKIDKLKKDVSTQS